MGTYPSGILVVRPPPQLFIQSFPCIHIDIRPHLSLGLPSLRDAEIASGLVCVAVPVLPQLIRRLAPVIKSTFSSYHRGSKGNGSKTFKGSWGGAKYDKHTADGQLGEWDPYGDLLTPKGDYLKMEGNSSGTKSEETVATKQASPGLSVTRDDFTEGGVLVRDLESGLHP